MSLRAGIVRTPGRTVGWQVMLRGQRRELAVLVYWKWSLRSHIWRGPVPGVWYVLLRFGFFGINLYWQWRLAR